MMQNENAKNNYPEDEVPEDEGNNTPDLDTLYYKEQNNLITGSPAIVSTEQLILMAGLYLAIGTPKVVNYWLKKYPNSVKQDIVSAKIKVLKALQKDTHIYIFDEANAATANKWLNLPTDETQIGYQHAFLYQVLCKCNEKAQRWSTNTAKQLDPSKNEKTNLNTEIQLFKTIKNKDIGEIITLIQEKYGNNGNTDDQQPSYVTDMQSKGFDINQCKSLCYTLDECNKIYQLIKDSNLPNKQSILSTLQKVTREYNDPRTITTLKHYLDDSSNNGRTTFTTIMDTFLIDWMVDRLEEMKEDDAEKFNKFLQGFNTFSSAENKKQEKIEGSAVLSSVLELQSTNTMFTKNQLRYIENAVAKHVLSMTDI